MGSPGGAGGGGAGDGAASTDDGGSYGTGGEGGASGGPVLLLPIEVLGSGAPDDQAVTATALPLQAADIASAQSLYVQCHRCGFYDAPEFEALAKPLTKVKASLRIVGGGDGGPASSAPWIDITNAAVKVDPVGLAHGGINGGLVTLGFHVALDDATRARLVGGPGGNRIEFRFNGTDGNSNGYRILDVQFQDASGKELSQVQRVWADESVEKSAGQNPSTLSQQGQMLWTGRNLLDKSPVVPRKIRAACNDCHASDGRDLQYFNYSNNSIVQRSRFHGFTAAQGQAIAAYLRSSLYTKVPHVPAAAPWNPPFQPGPGLDSKPAVEWTAGAGLGAVLPDGASFLKAFVGQPIDNSPVNVTVAEISNVMNATKTLNTREMPVPQQFPDWNAWLPPVHPLDIWTPDSGQTTGLFETGYNGNNPLTTYTSLRQWLDANQNANGKYGDWSHLTPDQRNHLQQMLRDFGPITVGFGGGSRGTRVSPDPSKPFGVQLGAPKLQALLSQQTAALADLTVCGPVGPCTPFNTDSFIERADVGLYHWMIVKQWEFAETYGLQAQQSFHGSVDSGGNWVGQGEARGWPYSWPSVFYVAPHMLYAPTQTPQGERGNYFSWENQLVSYYRTNGWYGLQVTVNPGWAGASNGPVDWGYTQGFITGIAHLLAAANAPEWITAAHLARYFEVNTKLSQLANTNIPFNQPDPSDPTNIWKNAGLGSKADLLFKLSPASFLDWSSSQPSQFRVLDKVAPGSYLTFVNGSIAAYASMFFDTTRGQYRICDPNNMQMGISELFAGQRFCIDAARTPLPTDSKGQPYVHFPSNNGFTTEQFSVYGVIAATKLGADPTLVQEWSAWNDRMWPQ